jgi:Domain of unknown function (DUF6438)
MVIKRSIIKFIFMKILVLLLCLGALGSCKSHKKMTEKSTETVIQVIPKEVFALEMTPCYGTCPSYKVVVFDNDSLVYEGMRHVAKEGNLSKKLSQGTVNQLVEKFRGANFFKFQNQYTSNMTDFPTTYISFTDKGVTKKIMDYYKAPESLRQLEKLIVDLVNDEVEGKK